ATIAITVTFLVYAFMLADYSSKDNYDIQNLSEHYIIPLMVIIDYFMFDKKGTIKWYHPLIWVGCIITYLPYIFIRANIVGNNTYTKYPYFFLNIDELGASEVALWCLGLLVFFTGLSYLVMLFDSKYNKNKNNLEK
ncbi:MAG: Pr6Pr family membrane protein, partial [Acholeplasmatales bacterium]|nr:Pr6Pr family membrane protein [Acholeplasmatales bacterium]